MQGSSTPRGIFLILFYISLKAFTFLEILGYQHKRIVETPSALGM
jgi:hypothetical protein